MKNLFKLLLIIILASVPNAFGAIITAENVSKEVVEQISTHLKEYNLDSFEVNVIHVPFNKINIDGENITLKVNKLNTKNITSRAIARVNIYSNGQYAKSVGVPISIKAYKEVYVAKHQIEKGEAITSEKLTKKKIDIANNTTHFLTDGEIEKGVSALKIFSADEVINSKFTKCVPDVEKNSIVKVIINSKNSIVITTEAVALSDGNIGDTINLQNKELKKIYTGKIIGENRVLVQI